ncbi:nuclear transport factor 2 family protein [Halobellus ruber]|uniref:Nuclear transport factor 2 family protein n=1 Tax=Halobellus ruber TaxID=2761102 RepID=A0A7J9SFA8_9EURY|nr:nuclear transport factor 2 family protein [Halobellus ruber]MBB6644799.1 nuclear transport factor 2 family protein [Halobellus ruber]
MSAKATIREYYRTLEAGDPLGPFFAADDVVKFGISERLVGGSEVRRGLEEQTDRTADWAVDSRALRVTDRGCHAWFSDSVALSWRDVEAGVEHSFETRWSGTLEARDGEWVFVGMHVSTPRSF